jgi:hypothetical protein
MYRPERGMVAFAVPLFGQYLRRTADMALREGGVV